MTETEIPRMTELTPRIKGLDVERALKLLSWLDMEIAKDKGELNYPFAFQYADRAQMRFAIGFPALAVLEDFWQASRILVVNPSTHLGRFPPEQLLTRRILPIEIALLGGQMTIAQRIANGYGLPLITVRAGLAGHALLTEARVISPGLVGEALTHPQHLVGVAAGVYSAVLASATRGYADEVKIALKLLADTDYNDELNPGYKAVMLRYAGLCEAILELIQPGHRNLPAILADQIQRYNGQLAFKLGDQYLHPTSAQRYIDTSSVAIFALALLSNYPLDAIPLTDDTEHYHDLFNAMTQPREFEAIEPHEAMRAAYEAAGIQVEPPQPTTDATPDAAPDTAPDPAPEE